MRLSKKNFIYIILSLILIAGIYFGRQYIVRFYNAAQERLLYEGRKSGWQELQKRLKSEISRFKGKSGIVIKDLETGWEFSHDAQELFPSASLTKIPLMAACFLAAEHRALSLDRNIALKSSDKFTGSGILKDMPVGSVFSVDRLIGLMIYESDNTAANILTNLVGFNYLNGTFKTFGIENTKLSRKIADYRLRDKGVENYTTAIDMALLLDKMYQRRLGDKNVSGRCISVLKLTRMNDRIPKYLPPEITVAHKTGLEYGVCHDAGIVFTRKGDFIIVVLTKHSGTSSLAAKEFIARISLYVYKYFECMGKKENYL
jgi:beta-lactamase class A